MGKGQSKAVVNQPDIDQHNVKRYQRGGLRQQLYKQYSRCYGIFAFELEARQRVSRGNGAKNTHGRGHQGSNQSIEHIPGKLGFRQNALKAVQAYIAGPQFWRGDKDFVLITNGAGDHPKIRKQRNDDQHAQRQIRCRMPDDFFAVSSVDSLLGLFGGTDINQSQHNDNDQKAVDAAAPKLKVVGRNTIVVNIILNNHGGTGRSAARYGVNDGKLIERRD